MTTSNMPAHVGIIMDGNGRWAQHRNMARTQGHIEGLKAAKRIVKAAADMGISYLTLYTFSTENWKRTQEEVGFIMGLVKKYLMAEFDFYNENKIRIRFSGNLEGLPQDIAQEVVQVCEKTAHFTGLSVILALNYGGRDEIVRAVRKITEKHIPISEITEATIHDHLDNLDVPDPDLIIRTAGEQRSSNFLLWESAYSEFYFSDKLWPDWDAADLELAIKSFQKRKRRFGGITT
ncbi:polyprenyl diphosphate synthase [Gracilinema caldarium]|uniref:polyprenyl diphosphate synthase n=1 Tax=Gracilinema caldarium TaxID=215591 RepID=UPI0026F0A836|nr:polyprenyl diphosphate synthase [Gracilinema caldarium]